MSAPDRTLCLTDEALDHLRRASELTAEAWYYLRLAEADTGEVYNLEVEIDRGVLDTLAPQLGFPPDGAELTDEMIEDALAGAVRSEPRLASDQDEEDL